MSATLSSLYLYPIKSCAPLALEQARVGARGLDGDRRWMVIDHDGRFITGRQLPRMTLIQAQPANGGLVLAAPGMEPLRVPEPQGEQDVATQVWKSPVTASAADETAHAWLTEFLGVPVRLVFMPDASRRAVEAPYAQTGDIVSFADSFPLMLVSEAALDLLNARLGHPVSMRRFRPNLVVSGVPAHAEDQWRKVRIGGLEFDVAKPCTRCVFVNVDPDVGERMASGEPLKTLTTYRRSDIGVSFGQHLIPRSSGTIRVGDTVQVLS